MARIHLDDVHLTFTLRQRGSTSLKDWVLRKLLRRPGPPLPTVQALRGVSFTINEGDRLGIIGHNGAGKSTLLRLLAGVYSPSSGTCLVEGKISSLFELALGFEPEATGWENITYRGYLQKESPRSIKAKMEQIAEFSELGDALDMPIRYYSSGMLVRLAFSIATAIEPEVLLIDEVLAAGDLAFMAKARQRMRDLLKQARVMVMVSHDLEALSSICDRLMWLDHGQVKMIGSAAETIAAYYQHMNAINSRAA